MSSWKSEERYFDICPMCNGKEAQRKMILLKKANTWGQKKLTRLCYNCYLKVLDFIGISDVNLDGSDLIEW